MSSKNIKTILLVEDEAITSIVTAKTLIKFGYNVITAETGEKAIDTISSNKNIDLILMDIDLGQGIDGTEAALIILKNRDIPVVFLSSHTEPEIVEKTEKITSYGYVVKNSSSTVLDTSIKMAFKLFYAKIIEKEKEERYRFLVENLNDAIFTLDMDNIITYVSPTIERLSQYKVEDILGKNFINFVHPDDIAMLFERYKLFLKGLIEPWEFRVLNKDSSIIHVRTSSNLIIKEGITIGRTVLMSNISDKKKTEETLLENNYYMHKAQDIGKFGHFNLDLETNIVDGSPELYRIFDVDKNQPILDAFADAVHPEDKHLILPFIERAVREGLPYDVEHRVSHRDGSVLYVHAKGEITYLRNKRKLVGIVHDITERKLYEENLKRKNEELESTSAEFEAVNEELIATNEELHKTEAQLRNSESKFETMLHTLVDGIVMVDIKGQIIYANKAAEKILGVGKDILGKYFQSREWRQIDENGNPYPLDKLPLSIVLRDHKPVQNLVHKLIAQDEECICISVNAAPLFDETGNFFGGIASFRDITAQKDIEQQLRESEQRNRLIVENINLGVFISNLEGKFILANTAIARITGYDSIKEILNIPSSSLYADQADRESVIKKLKESGSVKNMELLFMKKGGTTFWISLNAVLINEDDGSPRGIIGFIDDITERKIAAEKIKSQNEQLNKANKELLSLNLFLQESKKKYQQIVETAIEGMISIDSDSRITFISKQMSGMLGYTIEEMLGKKFESFIYDDQIPDHYEQMKLRAQGKDSIYERCIKRKDGERQWTLISGKSIIDSNGNFEGSFAMITDINELKKTENELKQKTEFLKYITDNMYDLVSLTDLKGIYTFVGKSHSILGYDPDFLIGKNVLDFVHPDDLPFISKEFYTKLALNENSQAEYRYKCKDGSYLWFETIGKILTDENNKQEKILFSTRNITDRKNAEYNIQKLLSEKDLILKEVHHRIKNNMSTIYGLLYLQAGSLKDQKAIEALEDAANRVQSMMVLYDKLYKSPDFQKISLADYLPALVDEISSNFHNSKSVKIEKQVEDFNLDAKRLQTIGIIINELITNIMKYAFIGKNDGLITIGAHLIKSDIDNQSIVSIEIKDNGNGLPESVDFENSTGFGLKLVWLLVKELNGSISINRQNGTRFMLDFKL